MSRISSCLTRALKEVDRELYDLIQKELNRQKYGLEMIASENLTSLSVLECLGSCLTNKYSEGLPGKRYYGGNEYIDKIEIMCQQRALKAFNLDDTLWGVNVQPYSGSSANMAVYTAILSPHERLMGLHLPDGGHLTHGFMSKTRRVSATSLFWESLPYHTDPNTGYIDYDNLQKVAIDFQPKLIVAGFSCYPRHLDYKRFREIADSVSALLFADIAHISGLVAAGVSPNAFEYAHVVTTTTHKLLRGPRSGVIFYRKDQKDLEIKINSAVFPGLQGGPHDNTIAAVATAFKQVDTDEFKEYAKQVIVNAQTLATRLISHGFQLSTGGTDNHLILVNLKNKYVNGSVGEKALDMINIYVNKNACPRDTNMFHPSGIRIGTPSLTTRGFIQNDIINVADMINTCINYVMEISNGTLLSLNDFNNKCQDSQVKLKFEKMKKSVNDFASNFPFPTET